MSERFPGGSAVPGGYYLDAARWAVVPVAQDGDRLPPGHWRRVPAVVALALVPILGVTFLMFMPVAGFLVLGGHLAAKVRALLARTPEPRPPPQPVASPPPVEPAPRPESPAAEQ